ncbi:MAG: DUF493 domain-containing protein [Ignavibacteriaceae bacterium]|nr:DUF493 domain-containing protein [Ignavibacteriaceae bacterium]
MILDSSKKPEITYPCEWSYKIIGNNIEKMLEAIDMAVSGLKYDVTPSNISKKGNYYSLNLTLTVPNEVVRDLIYQKLDSHESVKIIF